MAVPLMALPAVVLSVRGGANICLIFLFLYSLGYLSNRRRRMLHVAEFRTFWPVHWAMASMVCMIFIGQILRGTLATSFMDTPLRLALFAPVFWLLLSQSAATLQAVQWGAIAGAVVACAKLSLMMPSADTRIALVSFTNVIPYSDIALLMGVWSFLSLGWSISRQRIANSMRVIGGIAGVATSILSQSRGGWVALPFFAILLLWSFADKVRGLRVRIMLAALFIVAAGLTVSFNHSVSLRLNAAQSDIEKFNSSDNKDTSVGIRFQLWRGAWVLFKEHPLLGVGRENFSSALADLAKRKVISTEAAQFSHTHNEVLFNVATLGMFGLVSILSIYFLPVIAFVRELKNCRDQQLRTGAAMGLALCIGFPIFGLTETMFVVSMTTAFYTLSLAILLAYVVVRRRELASTISIDQTGRASAGLGAESTRSLLSR